MDLAPDFDEFLGCLTAHGVEYLVVGAYALALHGAPRFTGDLDILIRPTLANAERRRAAIQSFGFPVDTIDTTDIVDARRIIEMGVEPVQIYVMTALNGISWDDAWESRVTTRVGAHDVAFLGRDALLRNKRAAGRPKDLADVDALEGEVREPDKEGS
jgi:hypothetical protein